MTTSEKENWPGDAPRAGTVEREKVALQTTTALSNGQALPTSPQDVFDNLDSFRLRQSFDKVKTRKPLTTVGIRKPKAHEWFQSHPEYRYEGTLFLAKEEVCQKNGFSLQRRKLSPSWRNCRSSASKACACSGGSTGRRTRLYGR